MSAHLTIYSMAAAAEHPVQMRQAEQARRVAEAKALAPPRTSRTAAGQRLRAALGGLVEGKVAPGPTSQRGQRALLPRLLGVFVAGLVAALAVLTGPAATLAAPPPNDHLGNAVAIGNLPFSERLVIDAGSADGPTSCQLPSAWSFWYRYTPAVSGRIAADTFGSSVDTSLEVRFFRDGAYHFVGCNDNASGGRQSRVAFNAVAGTTYSFQIWTFPGTLSFNVKTLDTPPTVPALALTEHEPDEHVNGTTLYYNPLGNGGSFTVTADTDDPETGIARVEFPAVFGQDAAVRTARPYSTTYAWATGARSDGLRTVTAVNGDGETASATFFLLTDEVVPTVALDVSVSGAPVAVGQAIRATAQDPRMAFRNAGFVDGSGVARVEFRYCPGTTCDFAAGTRIGADAAAPYEVAWTRQPADGVYTLVARATDNVGNATDSRGVTVTVANPDTVAPTVSLSAPRADATLRGSAKLAARAKDAGSGVDRVTFQARRVGRAKWTALGQALSAPYSIQADLGRLAAGRYELRALAVDRAGNVAASAPVAVTITGHAPTTAAAAAEPDRDSEAARNRPGNERER